jgi:hypothetical protein
MRKLALAAFAAVALSGCTSDGQLTPAAQVFIANVVTASCQVDQAIPGLVAAGGEVTALVAPEYADEVATATKVDQLVHPAVVAACNAAASGSKPVAVTVTPAS